MTFAFLVMAASGVDMVAVCDKERRDSLCKV